MEWCSLQNVDVPGAEPLREALSQANTAALDESLEALPNRDQNALWKAIHRHVQVIVDTLATATTGESSCGDFNLVGKRVSARSSNQEIITGSIVELFEQPAPSAGSRDDCANVGCSTFMCRIEYWDGSLETVSVVEAAARIIGDESSRSSRIESRVDLPEERGLSSSSVEALTSVATVALAWLNYQGGNKSGIIQERLEVPVHMRITLGLLHDIIFDLSGQDGLALQEAIAKVCEAMWVGERKGAELLVAQLVPFLLLKALSEEARDADVKRLFGVRGALLLMDLDDASSDTLKGLLLRCTMHPRFLKTEIGRRFVVFLFGLQVGFIEDIHATIKNQVPHASHEALSAYGDIYLRAWRDSAGAPGAFGSAVQNAFRRAIEGCLQELMQGSVLANLTSTHIALRAVLQPLHRAKCRSTGTPGAAEHDTMLTKLWEPILWRSLSVASPMARVQATRALADAFPLQTFALEAGVDNDGANDTLLQKQFDALRLLVSDRDPRVRVAAVEATTEVLTEYWEAIPSKISRALITHFTAKLANDSASSKVREAAVQALTRLLANPLSHGVLKAVLPSMRNVVHDKSERVRACFLRLLQKLSTVRGVTFVHVVPVDDLLARLAKDSNRKTITAAMAKLLAPSFFPTLPRNTIVTDRDYDSAPLEQVQLDKVHLGRAVASLQKDHDATFAFYGAVKDHIAPGALARLAILLFNYAQTVTSTLTSPPAAATGPAEITSKDQQNDDVLGCKRHFDNTSCTAAILGRRSTCKGQFGSSTERKNRKNERQKKLSTALRDANNVCFTKMAMGKMEEKFTMVSRALGCAASILEDLEAATTNANHLLPVELREMLNKTVGDEEGLPAVYALLVKTGNSLALNSSCISSPMSRSLFRQLDDARCSALRLASCLAKDDIPALAPMLLEVILSGGGCEDSVVTESVRCLTLLCKWGCVEDVQGLLVESLDLAFCGAVNPALVAIPTAVAKAVSDGDHKLADADEGLERSSKRKRKPPTRHAMVATELGSKAKAVEVSTLPVAIAVKLIGTLTAGTGMLSNAARLSFLKNEKAILSLIGSLSAAKQIVSQGLKDGNKLPSIPVTVLVEAVEVYGRLLLHRYWGEDFGPFEVGGTTVSTCDKRGNGDTDHIRPSPSQDMLGLIRWAMDELLPVATARNADTEMFSPESQACDGNVVSPPAKVKRPSGKTQLPPSGGPEPLGSAMKTLMPRGHLLQARRALAQKVLSRIFLLASDWAHCCAVLPDLSIATSAIVKEIGINASGGDVNDLDVSSTVVVSTIVPLCRLCYQLAFRESQGGYIDEIALRLLLRSAHFQVQRTNANGHDESYIQETDDGIECQEKGGQTVPDGTVEAQCSARKCLEKLLMMAANRSHTTLSNVTEIIAKHLLQQIDDAREFFGNSSAVNVPWSSTLPPPLKQCSGQAVLSVVLGNSELVANSFVKHVAFAAKNIPPPLSLSADKNRGADSMFLHVWLAEPAIALLRAVCVSGEASLQLRAHIWIEASSSFPQQTSNADLMAVSAFFNATHAVSQE